VPVFTLTPKPIDIMEQSALPQIHTVIEWIRAGFYQLGSKVILKGDDGLMK